MEGEALAVAVALDKSRHFVLGCKDLIIAVDHKPLLKLFGDRSLDEISNSRQKLERKDPTQVSHGPAIASVRNSCNHCIRMAPSQPSAPPFHVPVPMYLLRFLVIVDRYSNWPIVERTSGGATGLIDSLRRSFVTYGIADEISSDGGSEFTATATRQFLKNWVSTTASAPLHLPTATVVLRLQSRR